MGPLPKLLGLLVILQFGDVQGGIPGNPNACQPTYGSTQKKQCLRTWENKIPNFDTKWIPITLGCLSQNNDEVLWGITFKECVDKCEANNLKAGKTFTCRSVDYNPPTGECDLSQHNIKTAPPAYPYLPGCYGPFPTNIYTELKSIECCLKPKFCTYEGKNGATNGVCGKKPQHPFSKEVGSKECEPGCKCYIEGCVFGNKTYGDGAFIKDACMILQCIKGNWKYSGKLHEECETCMIWGDPHIYQFGDDSSNYASESFEYPKSGNWTITQNGLVEKSPFVVLSEFVPCVPGKKTPTCIKSVTYSEPGFKIVMNIPEPDNTCTKYNEKKCAITVSVGGATRVIGSSVESFHEGKVLAFLHNHVSDYTDGKLNCMNVIGSEGLSISFCSTYDNYAYLYVWPMKSLKTFPSKLYGLCGAYTGKPQIPHILSDGTFTNDTATFADSWEISSPGSIGTVTIGVAVDKCLNDGVLWGITEECLNITTGVCEACDALKDACIFDLCHMPNHEGYAAGYANHMAVHTQLYPVTIGSCRCHYRDDIKIRDSGCVITEAAPVDTACQCSQIRAGYSTAGGYTGSCIGTVVGCEDISSPACTSPSTGYESCLQGLGNCGGYGDVLYPGLDCPSPWFRLGNQCFLIRDEKSEQLDWPTARTYCGAQASGADLAEPNDLKALDDYRKDNGYSDSWYFLGGSDLVKQLDWRWNKGNGAITRWAKSGDNPDGRPGDDCLVMWSDWGANSLADYQCYEAGRFVCERPQ